MLLRSSSTPILGSLLDAHHQPSYSLDRASSLPSSASPEGGAPPKLISIPSPRTPSHHHSSLNCSSSYSASPDRDSPTHTAAGFRRVQSDGNLERLSYLSTEYRLPPRILAGAPLLDSIPSTMAVYGDSDCDARDPGEDEDADDEPVIASRAAATVASDGAYSPEQTIMMADSVAICGGDVADGCCSVFSGETGGAALPPLYLARGLGIDSGLFGPGGGGGGKGGGGGGGYRVTTGNGGERSADLESFYRRMVEENPSDALFLRNYAEFLYQTKGDPRMAEEYYSRAILAEPGDGEVLSQYAKLVWELHHDQERASSYFERAVQAAPQDSGVLAAYANFLWETDDEKDGDEDEGGGESTDGGSVGPGAVGDERFPKRQQVFHGKGQGPFPCSAAMASATA